MTLGVSGDASAVRGLLAGCDGWYSVTAGLFPEVALQIVRAVGNSDAEGAIALSARLAPLWSLYDRFGGIRVMACAAALLGLCGENCLPLPLQGLRGGEREEVATVLGGLGLL